MGNIRFEDWVYQKYQELDNKQKEKQSVNKQPKIGYIDF